MRQAKEPRKRNFYNRSHRSLEGHPRNTEENPADVRATEKMAKLFDAIKQDNPDYMRHDAHAMNVFLSRLLFCLFAEDTGIFPENAVCNAIASHAADDEIGSGYVL